jgi:hypothetical protein
MIPWRFTGGGLLLSPCHCEIEIRLAALPKTRRSKNPPSRSLRSMSEIACYTH